jgi:uncharacterized protein (TIGR02001 family)
MKISILSVALAALFCGGAARADEAAPAAPAAPAAADNLVTFNAALVSDYRFRGISQTRLQPALQGGADYVNTPSGMYLGAWASTIKWTKDAGGSGDVELDIYGGKRGNVSADVTYDVGVMAYIYAGNDLDQMAGFKDANTYEVYGQLGYGPAYIKYSHAVSNLFGFVDSKNSGYLDIGANIDLSQGWTGNLHAGRQTVKNNAVANYNDWKVGVTKDFGVVTGALAVIGTDASKVAYANAHNGKFLGKTSLVLTVSKTF